MIELLINNLEKNLPPWIKQFLKFGLVGIFNTCFGYLIFVAAIWLRVNHTVALIITYLIAVPFNYLTTGRFVFHLHSYLVFIKFVLSYIVIFFINLLIFNSFMLVTKKEIISQALSLPFVVVANFCIFKYLVFNGSKINRLLKE